MDFNIFFNTNDKLNIIYKEYRSLYFDAKIKDILFNISLLLVSASLVLPTKLNTLCVSISVILWFLSGDYKYIRNLYKNKLSLAILLYYALYLLSIIYSENIEIAYSEVFERKLGCIFIPLLFTNWERILSIKFHILRAFYFSVTVSILVCIISSFISIDGQSNLNLIIEYFTYNNLSRHVGFQPIYLSYISIISFFLILYDFKNLTEKNKNIWLKYLIIFMLILHSLFVIFLSSRTEIMTLLIVILVLLIYIALQNKTFLTLIFLYIIILLLSIFSISINRLNKNRFSEMIELKTDYKSNKWGGRSFRIQKWKYSLKLWEKNKFFGVGVGDFQCELNKVYIENKFLMGSEGNYNTHNQFIQTLTTIGIPGLSMLLVIFFLLFQNFYFSRDWIVPCLTLVFIFSMTTESVLERNKGLIPFVFFSLLIYNINFSSNGNGHRWSNN